VVALLFSAVLAYRKLITLLISLDETASMTNKKEARRIDQEIHSLTAGADPFAAAMRATRMPMLITDPSQSDNPIVFVNDAFLKLTGYTREETLGRNCRFLQGPGTNLEDVNRVRKAVSDRQPIEIDLLNYRKNGTPFWNRLLVSPVFNEGELSYYFASQLDVTRERTAGTSPRDLDVDTVMQQRIADLTAAEERLLFTLKAGRLGTWTLSLPEGRLVASQICKANFGIPEADTFTYENLRAAIHPDDVDRWQDTVAAAIAGDGELHVEYRAYWPDGSLHWIEIRAQTMYNGSGLPTVMSGISIDITERKKAEEFRTLITQEMAHRIKNILATVQSVVTQSLRTDAPIDEISSNVHERINALARSQSILTGENFEIVDLKNAVERALTPFNDGVRFAIDGPQVTLSSAVSGALMMALHELATNAVKYGALSTETGCVSIKWTVEGERFQFVWHETNGPRVAAPKRRGFGARMIERALSATVQGEAKIEYLSEGLLFTLDCTTGDLR
jgi:PAS domain S-box-containing protein